MADIIPQTTSIGERIRRGGAVMMSAPRDETLPA